MTTRLFASFLVLLASACGDDDRPMSGMDGGSLDGDVAADGGPPGCPSGTSMCGEICVDTRESRAHCGACDNACDIGEACVDGGCTLVCPSGQTECAGSCVDTTSDARHCGECDAACATGEACVGGGCEISCPAGHVVCGAACVDTATDPSHCGGCDAPCAAGEVCNESVCATECSPGLTACSGACVDTQNDPLRCGACDNACPTADGATAVCVAGSCRAICAPAMGDCNADLGSATGDGCETPLATHPRNCGACARECLLANAVAGCASGACTIASCDPGWDDCDGMVGTGCELDVTEDDLNCGACGTACASTERCVGGVCYPLVGDHCGSVFALADGTNSVLWTAFNNDYLTTRPSCTSSNVDGPDIVLSYTAVTAGERTITISPPASTRWVMVASDAACGTVAPIECASEFGNPMVIDPFLMAGETVYLYVADTTSGTMPLSNPLVVEVAAAACGGSPAPPAVTSLEPANGSTASPADIVFRATFDGPVYGSVGTITITGDRGTSLSYDLSTAPAEVTFSADETVMTIDPVATIPSFENLTITWTGLLGKACGVPIPAPTWAFATGCPTGFSNCDGDLTNGCEVPTASDPLNCGGCGVTCPTGESCYGGACSTCPGPTIGGVCVYLPTTVSVSDQTSARAACTALGTGWNLCSSSILCDPATLTYLSTSGCSCTGGAATCACGSAANIYVHVDGASSPYYLRGPGFPGCFTTMSCTNSVSESCGVALCCQ